MFAPSREQARLFFFEAWRKFTSAEPLTDSEKTAAAIIAQHPEYHDLLARPERHLDRDYTPEHGATNPFLHLSLHLAVEEQISIDQPRGIRAQFERLAAITGSEHDAKHEILECLGEVIWQAQRNGSAPDGTAYLECLGRKTATRD